MRKSVFIIYIVFLSTVAFSQEKVDKKKIEYGLQISSLKSNYLSNFSSESDSFYKNFYIHNELNYTLNKKISLGVFFGYMLTDYTSIEQLSDSTFGGEIKTKGGYMFGANSILNILSLIPKSKLSDFKLQPYLSLELGYFYCPKPSEGFSKEVENGVLGNIGVGIKYFFTKKFAVNAELVYGRDLYSRFGLNIKL